MNVKYNEGRNGLGLALVDLSTDTLTLHALDVAYVFDADDGTGDLTTPLDSEALTTQALSADGYLTSDAVVFTGLAIGEDTTSFVLEDTTAGLLLAYYGDFAGDLPISVIGDGTTVTIFQPSLGWLRV